MLNVFALCFTEGLPILRLGGAVSVSTGWFCSSVMGLLLVVVVVAAIRGRGCRLSVKAQCRLFRLSVSGKMPAYRR